MPNYIPNKHVKRLFPYAFFDELYGVLDEYTPENAVFMIRGTMHESKLDDDKEKQFDDIREQMIGNKILEENNLYALDQGEFLIVDTYIERQDIDDFIKGTPIKRYILLAQYFDKNEKPVFAKDRDISTVEQMNEVLWDDPNLALVLMQFNPGNTDSFEETSTLGVIKGPNHFIRKLLIAPATPLLGYTEGDDNQNE